MSLKYGVFQPLRFFESSELKARDKNKYDTEVFTPLYPKNLLPPFQITRAADSVPFSSIKLVSIDSGTEYELIDNLAANEVELLQFNTYDILIHYGINVHSVNIPTGVYELVVSDWNNSWVSVDIDLKDFDPFDLENNDCSITKITYFDTCDVGGIYYATGATQYKNVMYFAEDVTAPEYEFNEEGEEDGLGNFNADYKKLSKRYLLQVVVPEFITDALQLMPLHSTIQIETDNGYSGVVDTISVNTKWQGEDKLWALADILFSTDFIVKTGCCDSDEVQITGCLRPPYSFVARLVLGSSDYNNFEYTDAADGVTKIPLQDNDIVLVESGGGILNLSQYSGGAYNNPNVVLTLGTTYLDSNEANSSALNPILFYYYGGTTVIGFKNLPVIDTATPSVGAGNKYLVKGKIFDVCTVIIEATDGFNFIDLVHGTASDFMTNGLDIDLPPTYGDVRAKAVGATGCIVGYSSTLFLSPRGVGFSSIGVDFEIA